MFSADGVVARTTGTRARSSRESVRVTIAPPAHCMDRLLRRQFNTSRHLPALLYRPTLYTVANAEQYALGLCRGCRLPEQGRVKTGFEHCSPAAVVSVRHLAARLYLRDLQAARLLLSIPPQTTACTHCCCTR